MCYNSEVRGLDKKAIGRRIRQAREDLGLTQADVADELRLTRAAVGKIEKGSSITLDNLFELEGILMKPVEYFLGLDTELSDDAAEWLAIYNSLSELEKKQWLGMMRAWLRERPDILDD